MSSEDHKKADITGPSRTKPVFGLLLRLRDWAARSKGRVVNKLRRWVGRFMNPVGRFKRWVIGGTGLALMCGLIGIPDAVDSSWSLIDRFRSAKSTVGPAPSAEPGPSLTPTTRPTPEGVSPAPSRGNSGSPTVSGSSSPGGHEDKRPTSAPPRTRPSANAAATASPSNLHGASSIVPKQKVNLDAGSDDVMLSEGSGDYLQALGGAELILLSETGNVTYSRCKGLNWTANGSGSIRSIDLDPYPDEERMEETQVCILTADGRPGMLTFYEGRNLTIADNSFHFNYTIWSAL